VAQPQLPNIFIKEFKALTRDAARETFPRPFGSGWGTSPLTHNEEIRYVSCYPVGEVPFTAFRVTRAGLPDDPGDQLEFATGESLNVH
jgi:hypothetical protein